jgi:geranylgeranyl diphosphate/geranylgeranyl-bacteriochlorophyllide a reductase
MENTYDIVVIGAGPAGCTFINNLKKDYRVLLIDRQKIPASKICGGLLTEESIEYLNNHHLNIPAKVFSYPKKLKEIFVNVDKNIERDHGYVYNINRNRFNAWMFSLVRRKMDVAETTSLRKIEHKDNKMIIHVHDQLKDKNMKISCRYLVGSDGVLSRTRKEIHAKPTNKYMALQDYGELDEVFPRLLFFFSKKYCDHFIWAMPKEESIVIGLPLHYSSKNNIDTNKLTEARKVVEKYIDRDIQYYQRDGFLVTIPTSLKELCLGKKNVLLIGEAAGWISSRSGDGISFALRSGYHCAEAFNSSSDNILKKYEENTLDLRKDFTEKLESFLKIQQKIKEYKKLHSVA